MSTELVLILNLVAELESSRTKAPSLNQDAESSSSAFEDLKFCLTKLRKSWLLSDENIEAKHEILKEQVLEFIRSEVDNNKDKSIVKQKLESLCWEERLIPQKLHSWCFEHCDSLFLEVKPLSDKNPIQDYVVSPSLLTKDNVYHAMLLADCVGSCSSEQSSKFFLKNPHKFEHVSITSENSHNEEMERYLLAKKDNVLFAAFRGVPDLAQWQQKYSSCTITEGTCISTVAT